MFTSHIFLLLSWVIFGTIHYLLAKNSVKLVCKRIMGSGFKYYRLFYSCIAIITLAVVLFQQFLVKTIMFKLPVVMVLIVAIPGMIIGSAIMLIAIRKYFFKLSGIQVLYPGTSSTDLEQTGLHGICRHPLYLGTLMFIWSFLLMQTSLSGIITCVSITTYTLLGIISEEAKLISVYGNIYSDYKLKIPMLIPGIRHVVTAKP